MYFAIFLVCIHFRTKFVRMMYVLWFVIKKFQKSNVVAQIKLTNYRQKARGPCVNWKNTHDLSHSTTATSVEKNTKRIKSVEKSRLQCLGSQWWRCCVRGGSTLRWHWDWGSVLHVTFLDAHVRRSCSRLWLFPLVLQHHGFGQHQTTRPSFTFTLRIAVYFTWLYGNILHSFGQVNFQVFILERKQRIHRHTRSGRRNCSSVSKSWHLTYIKIECLKGCLVFKGLLFCSPMFSQRNLY